MTIDTPKLAKNLQACGFSQQQVEAVAEALRDVTVRLDPLRRDVAVLKWLVGLNLVATLFLLLAFSAFRGAP